MSFGTSYAITPFIERCGYDGAFGVYGALTGALGLLGIVVFFTGKRIREYTARFVQDGRADEKPSYA